MKPKVAIIGGGASSLSFAAKINTSLYDVFLFEKKKRLGSKLLVAGKGGFNLTHSEPINEMIKKYSPSSFFKKSLHYFDNHSLRAYLKEIGIETYIGSSGRIFPIKAIKPIEVLKKLEKKISENNVKINYNTYWESIERNNRFLRLTFDSNGKELVKDFDYVIFGIGGASWKITGSSGDWIYKFLKYKINVVPFEPSNCAVKVSWPDNIFNYISGKYLKNILVTLNNKTLSGEIVLTSFGLEGTPIYALSKDIRESLNQGVKPILLIDFKPTITYDLLINKLNKNQTGSWSNHVEKMLNLSKIQMKLIKTFINRDDFMSAEVLCQLIKAFPIQVEGLATIDEAISTVGGIDLKEVNENFELKKIPGAFVIGEMLNWDAPTGGYLIQGCFSMGQYLGNYFNQLK